MALDSRHKIVLKTNENTEFEREFNLIVTELDKKQAKDLKKQSEKHIEALQNINHSSTKLARLSEKYTMLKEAKRIDEALHVMDEIEKIEKEILSTKEIVTKASESLEELYRTKLLISVSGDDKDAFFEEITKYNFNINLIFEEIAKAINESKEKK